MTDQQFTILIEKLDVIAEKLHGMATPAQKPAYNALDAGAEARVASFVCPKCQGPMRLRMSKNNKPFASCKAYPDCDGIRWMSGDVPPERTSSAPRKSAEPAPSKSAPAPGTESDDVPF